MASTKDKRDKVVISGYYGFGNIGDEAILTAIIDTLRSLNPEISFVVLSANPDLTSKSLNVSAINRMSIPAIIRELSSASLFISGGGGLMQDVTGPASTVYYGGLLKIAQMLGVPTMVYAQGIGPLTGGINKKLVKSIFNKTTAITIRENFSKQDLVAMGVKAEKIQVTADPVLLLNKENPDTINNILRESGLDPAIPTIGIAIRPWHHWYERQLKAFTSVVFQFAQKYGCQILLIPFQMSKDLWLCQETYTTFTSRPERNVNIALLQKELTPKEMMGLIGVMHLVIGMRLHSLIMAAASYVPAVGIAYDPKVSNFCSMVGYPCIPSVADLQETMQNVPMIEDVLTNYEQYKKVLQQSVPELQKLANNNALAALSLLK